MPQAPKQRMRKSPLANTLLNSATTHILVALEFFNRPSQHHRYEIAAELALAAWEKMLKAYLYRVKPRFKIFLSDGKTIGFNECREEVRRRLASTPTTFLAAYYNLGITYQYRNQSVHLYGQAMDAVLHGLFAECVVKFAEFMRQQFSRELLSSEDLGVLPVGFSRPILPKDFLSNDSTSTYAPAEVKEFLKSLSDAGEELYANGITPEHSVLVTYYVHFEDARKSKGADLTVRVDNTAKDEPLVAVHKHITATSSVRISTDKNAPAVRLTDSQIWDYFNLDTDAVKKFIKDTLPHVKLDARFWAFLKRQGADDTVLLINYLDPIKKKVGKKMYSDLIYQRLIDEYGEPPSDLNSPANPLGNEPPTNVAVNEEPLQVLKNTA